jgi:hypothetical protein
MTLRLDVPAPPNLALAPIEYSAFYQDQYSNILRLYFNRLDNAVRNVLIGTGGKYLSLPFGAFYDTTDQIAGSTTTAYPITLNSISFENGVTIENSSQITFANEGVYNIQFSLQLANTDNATQDIDVWFRKNGVDIANSNSRFGLAPRKSALDPYHVIASLNYVDSFQAGDYVQLYWCTTNVLAYIEAYTAGTTPTRPAIPSVILTATFVSSVPE